MKKEKFDLSNFEILKDSGSGNLIGGFSQTTSSTVYLSWGHNECPVTNNCKGGNCFPGCGKD